MQEKVVLLCILDMIIHLHFKCTLRLLMGNLPIPLVKMRKFNFDCKILK